MHRWAEVLSADAFSAFEEAGLDNDDKVVSTGQRFRDTVRLAELEGGQVMVWGEKVSLSTSSPH